VTTETAEKFTRYLMDPHAGDGPLSLEELVHRPQWMAWAACRDEPTETFFPARGSNAGMVRRIRRLCEGCAVRAQCLAFALTFERLDGWWGGTGPGERALMRRQRAS
jgi:WhiB family redox-sensing transcriptional regulator